MTKLLTFYLPNAKRGLCVVRMRNGLPCSARRKFNCATCDRHEKHEAEATVALTCSIEDHGE